MENYSIQNYNINITNNNNNNNNNNSNNTVDNNLNVNNNLNNNNTEEILNERREKLKNLFINEAQGFQNEIIDKNYVKINEGVYDLNGHYVSLYEDYLNSFYSLYKKNMRNPYFITPQQQNNPQLFRKYFSDYTINNYYPSNPKTEMYKKVYYYTKTNQYQ